MTDRLALVIGGSSEIGTAIGVELGALGFAPVLWGRDPDRLAVAAQVCAAAGAPARTDIVDVTDHMDLTTAVARLTAHGPLEVVVYAAGLFDWAMADVADPSAWDRLFAVNLVGAAVTTRLVLPHLLAAAPSALVYIGSGAAHTAFANNAAYVASKHGLAGLARATFLDVRDRDVKVSLVSPGLVAAGVGLYSPAGQEKPDELLTAADVAAAVRFVVTFPANGCPTEIRLQPQRQP